MLITREDIQRIGDEDTLLHFLEEKLNLSIPEGLPLEDITTKFGKHALGLSGVVANQVLDCQELSVSSGKSSGIILIRFNSESGYTEALRVVAEGLDRLGRNPMDLRFICMNEYFRPFAFSNFEGSESQDWQTAVLNIRVWTQENTHIHTSSEHELPVNFFCEEFSIESGNNTKDKIEINEFDVIESTSSASLLTKLEGNGTPLSTHEEILIGITPGYTRAFVINEYTYKQILDEDSESIRLIKRLPEPNQKWRCDSAYLICIPSSKIIQWPWSEAKNELEAEHIFAANYSAVSTHLKRYKIRLENRSPVHQGEFYWELAPRNLFSMTENPKIMYKTLSPSMQATYDDLKGLPLSTSFLIPTTDLSLLAVLNSKLFNWYAHKKFRSPDPKIKALAFTKQNMVKAPIALRTEEQKAELLGLVQQILDTPDSPKIPDIEREIDQLIYKLYELTDAEIALIEEESNK